MHIDLVGNQSHANTVPVTRILNQVLHLRNLLLLCLLLLLDELGQLSNYLPHWVVEQVYRFLLVLVRQLYLLNLLLFRVHGGLLLHRLVLGQQFEELVDVGLNLTLFLFYLVVVDLGLLFLVAISNNQLHIFLLAFLEVEEVGLFLLDQVKDGAVLDPQQNGVLSKQQSLLETQEELFLPVRLV